jgi:hypothetical protein
MSHFVAAVVVHGGVPSRPGGRAVRLRRKERDGVADTHCARAHGAAAQISASTHFALAG